MKVSNSLNQILYINCTEGVRYRITQNVLRLHLLRIFGPNDADLEPVLILLTSEGSLDLV